MKIDFGVSMRDEVFNHKLRDGIKPNYCYWEFSNGIPKGAGIGSKMWVANNGRWVGYFVIENIGYYESDDELTFYSNSFVKKDAGERRPFRGYTLKVPCSKEALNDPVNA
jgi:hypothetical protein